MPSIVERTRFLEILADNQFTWKNSERSGMAMAGKQSVNKGWFSTPGGRAIARSTNNSTADRLFMAARGKTVLDVGCAEGLISIRVGWSRRDRGARVEIVPEHVKVANKLRGDLPVTFEVGDANVWQPRRSYDIVIALALLQKVRNPRP